MEIANMFDIVFLIFLVLFGLKGFFNGLIREVSDFFGLVLGFTIGVLYYRDVGEFMHNYLPSIPPSICYGLSFTLLVMVIWSISNLIGYLVERKLSLPGLLIIKVLGIFVSILKYVVILAVIIAVFMTMIPNKQVVNRYFGNSTFFQFERKIGEGLFKLRPEQLERFFNLQMDRLRQLRAKIHHKKEATPKPVEHTPTPTQPKPQPQQPNSQTSQPATPSTSNPNQIPEAVPAPSSSPQGENSATPLTPTEEVNITIK
jgi:membrane protein required for colicin V production